jgi:hypothetical protein
MNRLQDLFRTALPLDSLCASSSNSSLNPAFHRSLSSFCFVPTLEADLSLFVSTFEDRLKKKKSWCPVPLVLDLRVAHDRIGSSTDPTLNGQLRYPNNLDQSLNDTATDKVRQYRADYNNNPPNTVLLTLKKG